MSQYTVYAPIALNAGNFQAFTDLLVEGGNVLPSAVAAFATANSKAAFREIKGTRPLVVTGQNGAYTQIRLFTSDTANPPAPSKMAALFLDVIPAGDNRFLYQPRQWLLGADAQVVIPYQMTCCSGLSALAAFKQAGQLQPALIENTKFVRAEHRDLFRLTTAGAESGLKIDRTGQELQHWYVHMAGIRHDCGSHAKIVIPNRLPAFKAA